MRRWIGVAILLLAAAASLMVWMHSSETASPPIITSSADLGLLLVDTEKGISVLAVQDKSLAEQAGICPGDVLMRINAIPLTTVEMLDGLLMNNSEDPLLIDVQRGNAVFCIKISTTSIVH